MARAEGPPTPTRVRAPLGQGRLLLPTSSRADAVGGLTLLNPNRPVALVAARLYGAWLGVAGPRWAGGRVRTSPAVLERGGTELMEQVRAAVGPFTGVAMIDSRQADRPRVAMLALRDGLPVAFVKLNLHGGQLARERSVLDCLAAGGVDVRTPRVLGHGEANGVSWMATSAMSSPWTRPVTRLPVGWRAGREFAALEPLLGARPHPDSVALHGDLTPWNLRWCAGEPWLLDWEDIAWGPPGADEAYFHATATFVCGAELQPASPAAVEHWTEIVSARSASGAEERFRSGLLSTLARMAP